MDRDPIGALLLKLRARDRVSDAEAAVLRGLVEQVVEVPAGQVLVAAGRPIHRSCLLIHGYVSRYKDLAEGQRQITDLHIAGDFVDLHGYLLKHLEHQIGTLTPVRVAYFPHSGLTRLTEEQPHLARLLWLSTLIDAAIQRERILSIGRRSARARIAHLLCELHLRLEVVGLADDGRFRFPVTQLDLADVTGLTAVHVNRMLRDLRRDGILTFRSGVVEIHDAAALRQVAEFDATYLFLDREPR